MTLAKLKVSGVAFDTNVDPNNLPNGSIYLDGSSNLNVKDSGGGTQEIAASSDSVLTKTMENLSGATILKGKPVAKKSDGSIVNADSDAPNGQIVIGVALENILDQSQGKIALIGPNVKDAISGLGFAPGDEVYLGENGGYIGSTDTLTGDNDSFVRVGFADCSAGAASSTANDLIMFAEVIARPL